MRAEDVAFSLQRVIKLNLTPAFILTQLGWSKDNVESMVKAKGDDTVELTIGDDLADLREQYVAMFLHTYFGFQYVLCFRLRRVHF